MQEVEVPNDMLNFIHSEIPLGIQKKIQSEV